MNALQSTCYQSKNRLKVFENIVQIIHANTNHWAVFSTCSTPLRSHNPDEALSVDYYDSLYSKLPENAETIISFLLGQNSYHKISLNCIPIHKQAGSIDCGLYAIAVVTSLAHGVDPETQVYRQDEM